MVKIKIGAICGKMCFLFSLLIFLFSFAISCENPFIQEIVGAKTAAFDSNGGSRIESQTVFRDQPVKRPANPTKSGFTFEGWYRDNETFLEAWDFAAIPSKDITLYAKWIDEGELPPVEPPAIEIVNDINITVTQPVTGGVPMASVSGASYTGTVSWAPGDNPFVGGVEYTATITITARQYYSFAPELTATVNGNDAAIIDITESALTLSYQFPPTRTVTGIAIANQPKVSYIHGDTLDLSGMVVRFTYNDASTEDFTHDEFASRGITVSLAHGTALSRSAHNNSTVTVTYGSFAQTIALTVSPKVMTFTVDPIGVQPYTGSAVTPTVTVKDGATTLTLTADYTVSYNNNTNAGNATVNVTGAGNYLGSTGSQTFVISAHATTFTIDDIPAQTYNGSPHTPTVTVKAGAVTLTLTTDYTVSYTNNTNAGLAGVTITGAGNYADSAGSATFTINPKVMTFAVDTIAAQQYTGIDHEPAVTVRDGTTALTLNTDYTVAYTNNVNAGTATATITGKGNYAGSTGSRTFTISPKVIIFNVDTITAVTYTGSAHEPTIMVRDGTTALTLTTHYTRTYSNNTDAGTATVTIAGAGNYAGSSATETFVINPKVITFNVDTIAAQTYTGSAFTPTITVRDGATVLTLTTHYTRTYNNNINAGTATITVTGAGNYAGSSATATFTINPAIIASAVLSITAPEKEAAPATTVSIPGGSHFTDAVSWSPAHSAFQTEVPYTVTITLTADTNYTFTGGLTTATINGETATVTRNGSTATLSYTFDAIPAYDFYAEVAAYATATGSKIIEVPFDITLPRIVNVPAPANSNYTLTIRSAAGGVKTLTRGFESDSISSGSLFSVTMFAKLIFENIVIDGNYKDAEGNKNPAFAMNSGPLVVVNNGGTLTLNNGAVLKNNLGGGVFTNNGTFNMNGTAVISGNTSSDTGGGVSMQSSDSTFNMNGGEISGNTAGDGGGGVYMTGGTFNMSGGSITGNFVTGTSANGAGVYVYSGTFRVGGTAQIHGNKKPNSSGSDNNVYLTASRYITLHDSATGDPASGMNIHVATASTNGVIVNSGASAGDVQYFTADDAGKQVYHAGGQLIVGIPPANPTEWDTVTNSTFGYNDLIWDIAYGDGKFVAVGRINGFNGKIAYSTDGINWNPVADSTFGTSSDIMGIAYGNGKFVAVGAPGKMAYSTDGENWTAVADSKFGTSDNSIWDIAYGGGKFVAVGENRKTAYSTDGINWVAGTAPSSMSSLFSIAYGGGGFVIGGYQGRVAYSTDGISWYYVSNSTFTSSATSYVRGIAYGNDKFVAGGINGEMAYSADGESWTKISNSQLIGFEIKDIAYGNNMFVAVADYGKMTYSADGLTWTAISNSTFGSSTIMGIAYGDGKFVAVGDNGKIAVCTP
jgi:uncharacterized repeat protein (TIGR02543 family)